MEEFDDYSLSAEDFSGTVRLFPLPNLVLFPHIVQPIHVFEPRYRALLEEAVDRDRLIAMATLRPGWEGDYDGSPPIASTACLCRVLLHREVDPGQYNVLLLGLRRVNVLSELPPNKPFREAKASLCEDVYPATEAADRPAIKKELHQAIMRMLPEIPEAEEHLGQLFGSKVTLGKLADAIAYMLDLDIQEKLRLLAEPNVYRRTEFLLEHLKRSPTVGELVSSDRPDFPPPFSQN